jgi:hypothetical protein
MAGAPIGTPAMRLSGRGDSPDRVGVEIDQSQITGVVVMSSMPFLVTM